MKIDRQDLLGVLNVASVGLTPREIIEGSNAFVFTGENLVTFNGEILTRVKSPLEGVKGAVPAQDFLKMLSRFPDDEVEVTVKGEEVRIKGKRREAAITRMKDVTLPVDDIPTPEKWKELSPALMGTLLQAARVCGRDETQPRTTEVHVTPELVEASDNFRLFRSVMETGLKKEVLIPASSLETIGGLVMESISQRGGWVHFQTKSEHVISVRCSKAPYPDLSTLLELENAKKITLPGNLTDVLSRAEVMHETAGDALVSVAIEEGKLTLKAQKESGWYRESKKIKYEGDPLRFSVHPKFLEDVLTKTRRVLIGGNRMRIEAGEAVFVVSLEVGEES